MDAIDREPTTGNHDTRNHDTRNHDTPDHDVIVLGTGAAGLVAALAAAAAGASVGLYERGDVVGGTTALSGGICWIPNNPRMLEAGLSDSREDALAYLMSLSHGLIDPALAAALVDTGPRVIEWVEAQTALHFHIVADYPDYHPERPGGKPKGGRSLDPGLYAFDELGAWADRVVHGPENFRLQLDEARSGGGDGTIPEAVLQDRITRDVRGRGQALAGGLLGACLARGITPVTGARAIDLVVEDGRVVGVRFAEGEDPDATVTREVRAERGVVIATGGFEWSQDLVKTFLRGPMTHPASIPTNTGDGLRMAMRVGADLGTMREAWWVPVVAIPGDELLGQPRSQLINRERTLPRSIMVNRRGRRFTNEAANYNALGGAFHQFDVTRFEYGNLPCFLVFDEQYLRTYGFAELPPGAAAPDWMRSAGTLAELATLIDVDAEGLVATVERWNALVATGSDPDFGRGESAYDGWNGDHRFFPGPGATLGPLTDAPFYAIEVLSGTLGTKGGPRTDTEGQVLDHGGAPIPGLYAAGNAMAGVTGMVYGGAGGTLGPAITFGYRAGHHAATGAPA